MARELHLSSLLEDISRTHFNDLIHLEHSLRHRVKVSSAHYEDSGIDESDLDRLEIVREVRLNLHLMTSDLKSPAVVDIKPLRVLFHDMYIHLCVLNLALKSYLLSACGNSHLLPFQVLNSSSLAVLVALAIANLNMLLDFLVSTFITLALGALKYELLHYFFDRTVDVDYSICHSALPILAIPLACGRNLLLVAVEAIEHRALRAFLGLDHNQAAYLAQEMVDDNVWQVLRDELIRLHLNLSGST